MAGFESGGRSSPTRSSLQKNDRARLCLGGCTCLGGVSAGNGGSGFFAAGRGGAGLPAARVGGGGFRGAFLSACFPTFGNLVTLASLRAFGFAGALATLAALLGGGRIFFAALRLLMEIPRRMLGRGAHHPELARSVDDRVRLVLALVLDHHHVGEA